MIARRLYLLALMGKPVDNLRARYPDISRQLDTYLMCKIFNTLPREGGLDNQWQETIDYFKVFLAAENEVKPNE